MLVSQYLPVPTINEIWLGLKLKKKKNLNDLKYVQTISRTVTILSHIISCFFVVMCTLKVTTLVIK